MGGTGEDKGKGKGKAVAPPAPVDPEKRKAAEEKLAKQRAEERAAAEAHIKLMKEKEAKEREFNARLSTFKGCDIEQVPWDTAQMMIHLVGGKGTQDGGVQVVQIGDGEAVCVRSQDSRCEVVALAVANAVGVRVAQFRMVHDSEPEWELIKSTLSRVDLLSEYNEKEWASIMERAKQKGWADKLEEWMLAARRSKAVLQFIKGTSLDAALGNTVEPSEDLFFAIGRLSALDLLLNNMDRVPLPLWDNALGNLSNVMVGDDGAITGIDQQVFPIVDEDGMEEYLTRASKLVTHLMRSDYAHMVVTTAMQKVESAFLNVINLQLPQGCLVALCKGMREGLVAFEQSWSSGSFGAALDGSLEVAGRCVGKEHISAEVAAAFVRRVAEAIAPLVQDAGRKGSM